MLNMSMNKAFKKVTNDVLKVGTFFVVTQLLANKSLADKAWQTEALNTLIGFAVYELVVARFVDPKMFGDFAPAVNDVAKFGTMLVVVRYLSGQPFDQRWMMSSGAMLAGFVVYNLIVKKMISTGQLKGDMKQIADDWLQWGTMLVVQHVLQGGNPMNAAFLKDGVSQIVGLNVGSTVDMV